MTSSEWVLLSTVRVDAILQNGVSTGTGFFFNFCFDEKDNTCVPTIVTNKHVVRGSTTGKFRFSVKDNEENPIPGEFSDLTIPDFERSWIMHPDPEVDLCVLPIADIHKYLAKSSKGLYYTALTIDSIPSEDELKENYSRIEDITIVGYPDGFWDKHNNMPIVRKGITATSLQLDFNNKPNFLVDAAIYQGSSGSPVFIYNQGAYTHAKGGLIAGTRLKLVGIIHAVALHTVEGEVKIVDIPAAKTPVSIAQIPNNLGVAIHARKLLDFENILAQKFRNK